MQFLIIVHGYDENHADCSCDYVPIDLGGGCVISKPTPPGYKCQCFLIDLFEVCNGFARECADKQDYGCDGCKEKRCCEGNCKGYAPNRLL